MRALLVLLAGCWTATPRPVANEAPATTATRPFVSSCQRYEPAADGEEIEVKLDGAPWTLRVPKGSQHTIGKYDDHLIELPSATLKVFYWPPSDAFVRTFEQHLEGVRQDHPRVVVLHECDRDTDDYEAVVQYDGKLDGAVLRPGAADTMSAMCSFELAAGASWREALAVCQSLASKAN